MTSYLTEFSALAVVHALAMMSPGPDFAIVIKQSVAQGRKAGVFTAWGIAAGLCLHLAYSLLGVGFIVAKSPTLFFSLKLSASLYLIWIGCQALRATPSDIPSISNESSQKNNFLQGILTNALNPKVTLFFLALFSVVIDPETPILIQCLYGVWIVLVTGIWFSGVACLFSTERVRGAFQRLGHWFERIMGLVLLLLGVRLITAEVK